MEKVFNGIVIFGEMGAGKDVLAAQFNDLRHNSRIYNMGILCREMMKVAKVNLKWRGNERYVGQTIADKIRELDTNIMCDYILALIYERGQNNHGWDNSCLEGEAFERELIKQLSKLKEEELPIIVGGRTLSDYNYWKSKQFLIVGVKVSDEVRKARLASRDGVISAVNSSSTHNTEAEVPYIINNLCDEVLSNDGSLEELKKKAEGLLLKYGM